MAVATRTLLGPREEMLPTRICIIVRNKSGCRLDDGDLSLFHDDLVHIAPLVNEPPRRLVATAHAFAQSGAAATRGATDLRTTYWVRS